MNTVKDLREAINNSKHIVFIGGAGVSTASGIPDFRGKNGIYTTSTDARPEDKLSKKYFRENTSEWFKFYRKRMMTCHCTKCDEGYAGEYIKTHCDDDYVSRCEKCGGVVRPDITLYGEPINAFKLYEAADYVDKADMIIVAGTALKVYPVTGLVRHFDGKVLAILNDQPTIEDRRANIVIRDNLADVFSQL